MSIKLAVLKTGETVIGDFREVIDHVENKFLGYKVSFPFVVNLTSNNIIEVVDDKVEENESTKDAKITFNLWAPLSDQTSFEFVYDFVNVIYNPHRSVIDSYTAVLEDYQTKHFVKATADNEQSVVSGSGLFDVASQLTDATLEENTTPLNIIEGDE